MTSAPDIPTVRFATPSDAGAMQAIYAPFCTSSHVTFELTAPSVEEMATRIALGFVTHPWLVATDGDDVLGYAYGAQHRERAAYQWSCEVTVYIAPNGRRRGIGSLLYTPLLSMLQAQGFVNAYAVVALPNEPSAKFHESNGFVHFATFERVGWKDNAWRDVGWWRRELRGNESPQALLPTAAINLEDHMCA